MSFQPPGYCPNCGDHVEAGALSCPECGSCSETGWDDDALYDGLDLPSDEEDPSPSQTNRKAPMGTIGIVALIVLLVYVFVFR